MQDVWSGFQETLMKKALFFNYLANHEDFLHTAKEVWDTSPKLYHSRSTLSCFHRKLKLLKFNLRALNRTRYGDLSNRTKQTYEELCACQNRVLTDPSPLKCSQESKASARWQKLARIEEKFWLKKSCIRWLQAGYLNTVFYHRFVQTWTARNAIQSLTIEIGEFLLHLLTLREQRSHTSKDSYKRRISLD